jgi:hypothetical protein
MKSLISHLWRENHAEILEKSRANCHTRGVDSVMLLDRPGAVIRLFYARGNQHDLWRNCPLLVGNSERSQSVAFHGHHCNLTLRQVTGNAYNWIVKPSKRSSSSDYSLRAFRFHSALAGERQGRFEPLDIRPFRSESWEPLRTSSPLYLSSTTLHTMWVPKGESASWLVFEGEEDPRYDGICYSDSDLTNWTPKGLYGRMSERRIVETLTSAGLL